jgi:hypothetical protein
MYSYICSYSNVTPWPGANLGTTIESPVGIIWSVLSKDSIVPCGSVRPPVLQTLNVRLINSDINGKYRMEEITISCPGSNIISGTAVSSNIRN